MPLVMLFEEFNCKPKEQARATQVPGMMFVLSQAIRKNKAKFWAIFSIITSKHAKKHYIEIIKINYLEKFLSPKTAEMAENGRFVGPRGPNYNPFFNFFANHFKI